MNAAGESVSCGNLIDLIKRVGGSGSSQSTAKVVDENAKPSKRKTKMNKYFFDLEGGREKYMKNGAKSWVSLGDDGETSASTEKVRWAYFTEAQKILHTVVQGWGSGDNYIQEAFGRRIDYQEATDLLLKYLWENGMDGAMKIIWSKSLGCSALMTCRGSKTSKRYSLYIRDGEDNAYLTEAGIHALMNHEVFTHYIRFANESVQAWVTDRGRFGLRPIGSTESRDTEEGLASIHTVMGLRQKYLFTQALSYYTACMATKMTFEELYRHLTEFVSNPDLRWKVCVRAKLNTKGKYDSNPHDQCYLTGAIEIMRQLDTIDTRVLMSGKLTLDDLSRVSRVARTNCIKIPPFMKSEQLYKARLKQIAVLNGVLSPEDIPRGPRPAAAPTGPDRGRSMVRVNHTLEKQDDDTDSLARRVHRIDDTLENGNVYCRHSSFQKAKSSDRQMVVRLHQRSSSLTNNTTSSNSSRAVSRAVVLKSKIFVGQAKKANLDKKLTRRAQISIRTGV